MLRARLKALRGAELVRHVRDGRDAGADHRAHARRGAARTPDMKQRPARRRGPVNSAPSDFTAFVKSELRQWSEVGCVAKIQPAD